MHRLIFLNPLTIQPAVCIHCKPRPQKSSIQTSIGELKTHWSGSPSSRCHTQRLPSESLHVATLVHSHGHRPARPKSPSRAPITLLLGLRKPASVLSSLLHRLPAGLRKRATTALQCTQATSLVTTHSHGRSFPRSPRCRSHGISTERTCHHVPSDHTPGLKDSSLTRRGEASPPLTFRPSPIRDKHRYDSQVAKVLTVPLQHPMGSTRWTSRPAWHCSRSFTGPFAATISEARGYPVLTLGVTLLPPPIKAVWLLESPEGFSPLSDVQHRSRRPTHHATTCVASYLTGLPLRA